VLCSKWEHGRDRRGSAEGSSGNREATGEESETDRHEKWIDAVAESERVRGCRSPPLHASQPTPVHEQSEREW